MSPRNAQATRRAQECKRMVAEAIKDVGKPLLYTPNPPEDLSSFGAEVVVEEDQAEQFKSDYPEGENFRHVVEALRSRSGSVLLYRRIIPAV